MEACKENIQLLNILDGNFNYHYTHIIRLIDHFKHEIITPRHVDDFFTSTSGISLAIKNALKTLDRSYFSVYCLLYFNISIFTVDKLRKKYKTLTDISKDQDFNKNGSIHPVTLESINDAIRVLVVTQEKSVADQIFDFIRNNEPCQNAELKNHMFALNPHLPTNSLDNLIDTLIRTKKIKLSVDGYRMPLLKIDDYLDRSTENCALYLKRIVTGHNLASVAYTFKKDAETIEKELATYCSTLPKFESEEKARNILDVYKMNNDDLKRIGLSESICNYVRFKYNVKGEKRITDYVNDHALVNTPLGSKLLSSNRITVCINKIVDSRFLPVFKEFCEYKGIFSFNLKEIKKQYNAFAKSLNYYNSRMLITPDRLERCHRQLLFSEDFISVSKDRFIRFCPDEYSSDFLESLKEHLSSFDMYGTLLSFYKKNTFLCNAYGLYDENDLFALSKRLFEMPLKDKITFIRNPVLSKTNLNKDQYLQNLLLDLEMPCSVDRYLDYVVEVTGLKRNTTYGFLYKFIGKLKNKDGLLSLDNDLSQKDMDELIQLLGDRDCVGFNYLKRLIELKHFNVLYLNSNILRKIGYVKTDVCIYKEIYSSKLDAVKNVLSHSDLILSENDLERIANVEYFYYRLFEPASECFCLRIEDKKYLNLVARRQCSLIKRFKKDLLRFCVDEKFYTVDNLITDRSFLNFLDDNEQYKDFLYSFNTRELLKSIIAATKEFNYIDTRSSFIFSESDLSIKIIISKIMEENSILTLTELQEILFNEYGIDNKLRNTNLSDMGFYCPPSSEKVYLNVDYFNLEMEEILHENS